MSLIAELKRRNVFRVATAYAVSAWLLVEVADLVLDAFGAPDWVVQTIIVLLVLGFPLVVFFSWAYEVTPDGIRREAEIDRSSSITHITARRLDWTIIVLLVVALGFAVYDRLILTPERGAHVADQPAQAPAREASEAVQSASLDDKSIAVLPFVNMSPEEDQEYFSDGLSEELLNLLTKIPDLRVAARTSSFSFKEQNLDIPEIGERLNVAHVLEGSVRKAGDQVRITAQLVKADDGFHLWSETYDRTLDNIFAIQDEIAAAVVDELKVKLLGEAPHARETDPDTYALYLKGLHLGRVNSPDSLERSNELLQQVLELDPHFAPAWTGLAANFSQMANVGLMPGAEGFKMAREAALRALEQDPTIAMAHAVLGDVAMQGDQDFSAGAKHLSRAVELEPSNPDVLRFAVQLFRSLGRLDEGTAVCEYIIKLDPLNNNAYYTLAVMHRYSLNVEAAERAIRAALELSPGRIVGYSLLAEMLLYQGKHEAALEAALKEKSDWRYIALPIVYYGLGRTAEADAALEYLIENFEDYAAYNIAYIYAYQGEADLAFEWLEKAIGYNDPGLNDLPIEWYFSPLHDDPRWLPLLERLGKAPWQLAKIDFEVNLPD